MEKRCEGNEKSGKEKTVFISGASRGIGAAIARRLAERGYDIWLNYKNSGKQAEELQKEIETLGQSCHLLPFDVSDEAAAEEVLSPLLERTIPWGVVHNAGFTRDTLLPLMGRNEWDSVIDVHLNSFFILSKLFTRHMVRAREGRIVVMSSLSGQAGQAGQVNYSAAKAGLIGAVKALARELARRNVLVNAVAPGLIDTEMLDGLPAETLEKMLPLIPMGRLGNVDEVAGVVEFLLGADSGYMTGQILAVNGGAYM